MLPPLMPKPLKVRATATPVPARATSHAATEGKQMKSALRVFGRTQRSRLSTSPSRVLASKADS